MVYEGVGGTLPKTAIVRSGGGGLHLYFQHDEYSRQKLGMLGVAYIPNPDDRAEDRKLLEIFADTYSLQAPGTVHYKTGRVYSWEKGRAIRPRRAPRKFVDFLVGLPWTGKSPTASVDGLQDLSQSGCRVKNDKDVQDLFATLRLEKVPTPTGFKFHPVHAEKCPAAGRKHRGSSNSVWLFFYNDATRTLRSHCSGCSCADELKKDRTRAALEALGANPEDWLTNERLGKIIIGGARIHEVIEKCEQVLIEAKNERLFQHGTELVHVTSGNEQNAAGMVQEQTKANERPDISRPSDVPFLVPATKYSLQRALSRTGLVFRTDGHGLSQADPPEKWSSQIMDRLVTDKGKTPWPCIRFVANSPTLLPNGDVIETEGYHKESGIWFDKRGVEFPPIPKNPTLQDAQGAFRAFEAVYHKFDFRKTDPLQNWNATPAYSALLSTILSVAARNLVPTVPMLAISAPVAGAGKTLLADTIFGVTTGMKSVTVPFDNTEEFDKLLPTILRQGTRLVLIDNVDTTLRSPPPLHGPHSKGAAAISLTW